MFQGSQEQPKPVSCVIKDVVSLGCGLIAALLSMSFLQVPDPRLRSEQHSCRFQVSLAGLWSMPCSEGYSCKLQISLAHLWSIFGKPSMELAYRLGFSG